MSETLQEIDEMIASVQTAAVCQFEPRKDRDDLKDGFQTTISGIDDNLEAVATELTKFVARREELEKEEKSLREMIECKKLELDGQKKVMEESKRLTKVLNF